jgi:hypothetical protein
MRCLRLIAWLLVPSTLLACKCQMSLSVCHEFAIGGVIFIGTVESVTPSFLDRWNSTQRPSLPLLNEAEARYHDAPSTANLGALKDTFRKVFPDLPADSQKKLESAHTPGDLSTLFSSVLDHGKRVHFQVGTVFRNGDDDDQAGAKDDDKPGQKTAPKKDEDKPKVFDCGYDFQVGETYLVFADDDEETTILETSRCSRTNRLTDAGSDLSYLYFLQNSAEASGRLEGFITANPYYQLEFDQFHDPEKISSPIVGATVELRNGPRARYASTDGNGRFVFDGLATADYQVAAFEAGYPDNIKQLQSASKVHVETKGCAAKTILVP